MTVDTSRTQWSVQRRDTSEFWCADAWRTTQEWFEYTKAEDICRAWPELPLALTSRDSPLRRCDDCVLNLGRDVLRALGTCPRWGEPRHGVESRCPAFVAKDGAR